METQRSEVTPTVPDKNMPVRVLLADDHDILRQGLKLLFKTQADIHVIGEARTGKDAVALTKELQPDIVVMDISLPDMDGLEACRQIRLQQPEVQVLMLTMHESEEYFLQSLRMGASGYLVKKAAPSELGQAVRTIAHGGAYLYPGLAKSLIRIFLTTPPQRASDIQLSSRKEQKPAHELELLTRREMEVLKLVAAGHTNQEIADLLVLSIKTVQAHRANVMEKLELHDITHLVRFAIRHGLIPFELSRKEGPR
jgi:DNA-binding NarL/FixJ family response regulator